MALTLAKTTQTQLGNKRCVLGTLAFDSSYPAGGETFTPGQVGLRDVENIQIESVMGYHFEYDYDNDKIKVFAPAPPIVYEEVHTIASNAITLDYPAAFIINAASATQHQIMVDPSATLAANQMQLTAAMAEGVRTGLTFHASTSGAIKVTYITQAWRDVWLNRVASEVAATSSDVATLAYNACAVESVHGSHATSDVNIFEFLRGGDSAGAGECEIDYTDSGASSATTLTFVSTDAITGVKATYIKKPSSGFLSDRFVEDEDCTISTAAGNAAYPILIPSLNGQLPDYTAANERDAHNLMMAVADGLSTAGECYIDWFNTGASSGNAIKVNDTSSDAVSLTYIRGLIQEIPGVVPLEVKNGTDLSALSGINIMVVGM